MRVRSKLLAGILGLCMVAFCAVGLTACKKECSHEWGEWTVLKAATCSETGVQEWRCVKCGEVETDILKVAEHTPSVDDGDCTTPITCSVCGEVATPANATHTGGTATCSAKAQCSVCGKEYGEFASHLGEQIWVKHLDSHYYVYSCCYSQATNPEKHTIAVGGACAECGFNPTMTVESVEAAPGDKQVKIAISLNDNPGIVGLMITPQYSSDVFEMTEAKSGEALSGLTFTAPSNLGSGCTFLWDGERVEDKDIKNGEVLILTFDIAENVPEGEYSILLKISVYDNELTPFTFILQGGKVTIKNK